MSDLGYNIWSVISSVLGLLGLLPLAWIYTQLPSRKFRALERLMADTEGMFRKGLDDGLYTCETDLCKLHSSFLARNLFIDDLRDEVCTLDTWPAELAAWWGGLSNKIARVRKEVKQLRTKVIDSSSRNRRRLAEEGYAQILARYSSARSQERRSSILSFISHDDSSTPSEPTSDPAQAGEVPPALEWYPPPRRTDSPLPILEHDASLPTRLDSLPHASLREDIDPATVSDADPQDPSWVTPRAAHGPHINRKPTCEEAASPFVSDADLKRLLALALISSRFRDERGKHHRATRRDVLLRFGKHLFGPDTSFDEPEASSHTRHAKRTRLKRSKCGMKGYHEVSPQRMSKTAGPVPSREKEPPELEVAQDDESDAADWQDD